MSGRTEAGTPEAFEEHLARCIDARALGDARLLERLLAGRPERARLEGRLRELEELGLLEPVELEPRRIGGHDILERLGRGGMGTVYRARELASGRTVALKLASPILDDGEAGQRARTRFEREVHAIAQLDHPGIVTILSSGQDRGRSWYSMEHVQGALLAHVIERLRARGGSPDLWQAEDAHAAAVAELAEARSEAVDAGARWAGSYVDWSTRVVRDVAAALDHAHARGVVHRDVKPANVLVRPDGSVALFDFGLAHVGDQSTLTRTGEFAGTPYAVAPEQADSQRGPIDARTDVWGAGVCLYELLALRRPFDGHGPADLLRRVLVDDPLPLRRLHPGIPRALENVTATALEKRPERRYAHAGALARDLDRALAGRPVEARGASLRRRTARFVARRPAAAAGLAAGALIAVGLPIGLVAANAVVREHARRAEAAALESSRLANANAAVVRSLVELFEPLDAATPPTETDLLALLDAQAQRLEVGFDHPPLARAALLEATGTVFANLGRPERARPMLDRALAMRELELGEHHPTTVALLEKLAAVSILTGSPEAAEGLCERALDALASMDPEAPADLGLRLKLTRSRARVARGRFEHAARELEGLLASADGSPLHADVLEELAHVEHERGDLDRALERVDHALFERRSAWLPDARALARALDLRAAIASERGDFEAAGDAHDEARALRAALRARDEPGPPDELRLRDPTAEPYRAAFQSAITALQARHLDEAADAFRSALRHRPGATVCMFNLAGVRALAGDLDDSLIWFERAVTESRGRDWRRLAYLTRDPDLAALQDEPRFRELLDRLADEGRALRAWVEAPALRRPREPASAPPSLLIALHGDGATKESVLDGPLGRAAEELGWLAVALSAPLPLPDGSGYRWLSDVGDLEDRLWRDEGGYAATLRAFVEEHPIDRRRVVVAGVGSGALIASDLALRAPGLVRGALLIQGPARVDVSPRRVRVAQALGLRIALLCDPARPLPWVDRVDAADGTGGSERYARALERWLAERCLDAEHAPWPAQEDARVDAIVRALGALIER